MADGCAVRTAVAGRRIAAVAAFVVASGTHAAATERPPVTTAATRSPLPLPTSTRIEAEAWLAARPLALPVEGVDAASLRDTFDDGRPGHRHEALDIAAPRGRRVYAVDGGKVVKLFTSVPGGLTVYQLDPQGRLAYYYAHLDRYAPGLREGMTLRRCDLVGYVGTSGNAPIGAPHLHFAAFRLGPERHWWKGEAINPFPPLSRETSATCGP